MSSIENARTDPQAQAVNALRRHLLALSQRRSARYYPTFDEEIDNYKKFTLADVKKFYADFYGASNAELAIVGDFDPAEIQKLATELFRLLEEPRAVHARDARLDQARNREPLHRNARQSQCDFRWRSRLLPVDDDDPDYPALFIANTILGSGPESRLFERIRGKDGLSYQVGESIWPCRTDEKFAQFLAFANCNPQNILKVEADFKDEIAKMLTTVSPPKNSPPPRKPTSQDMQVARSQDRNLAAILAQNAQYNRTMAREAAIDAKIAALTPAEISAALKKRIDPSSISIFKAGDLKKAGITQ